MKKELLPEQVSYFEAMENYTKIHYADGTINVSGYTLKKFELSLLNYPSFSRIHRSFIINKNFISTHIGSEVTLVCGKVLPVARRRVV